MVDEIFIKGVVICCRVAKLQGIKIIFQACMFPNDANVIMSAAYGSYTQTKYTMCSPWCVYTIGILAKY